MEENKKGLTLAMTAAVLWGLSGIFAELLMEKYSTSTEWLVSFRMVVAGCFLLLYAKLFKKKDIFEIFKNKYYLIRLFIFSILGMMGLQFTYFKTIEYCGTAIATIFQYMAPIFILIFLYLKKEKKPDVVEIILVLVTFLGVFFIATNGNIKTLSAPLIGIIFGFLSTFACVFYTIMPVKLLVRYEASIIVGWAMLFGGFLFQFIHPLIFVEMDVNINSIILLILLTFFGTIIAFLFFINSLKYIDPTLASILTVFEPILAAVLSVFIFGKIFGKFEILGFILVLVSVTLLTIKSSFDAKKKLRDKIEINNN